MSGTYIGCAGVGIIVVFTLWAYGFCGIFGWLAFDGQIDKDLAILKERQAQIERRLI